MVWKGTPEYGKQKDEGWERNDAGDDADVDKDDNMHV